MDTVKINVSDLETKIIAHRGLSGIETENSIAAFIAAANRSYFGIETDVHVTKDNKFIISKPITPADIKADDIKPVETPTTDRCIELYYEYINKGKMVEANAMYNIITYKNDENWPLN